MKSLVIGLVLLVGQANAFAQSSKSGKADASAEEIAVRTCLRDYAAAVNDRDWARVSALLDPGVTYRDEDLGLSAVGRDALITQIKDALQGTELKLSASVDSVDFSGDATANARGTSSLGADDSTAATSAFEVTIVRKDGRWLVREIVETAIPKSDLVADDPLASLAWLEGTWQDDGESSLVSNVRFLPGRNFLVRTFSLAGETAGFQVIGFDAKVGQLRSWSYFTDGSFATGEWTTTSEGWLVQVVHHLANGSLSSGTYSIKPTKTTPIDSMVVKLVGHEIDGQPVPRTKIVTVSRVLNRSESATQDLESGK